MIWYFPVRFFQDREKGFALPKMLQSSFKLTFSLFQTQMKLESSAKFLFESYLKALLCL